MSAADRYLVGAYPAYPPGDAAGTAELLAGLAAHRLVGGLELPFTGAEPDHPPAGADPGWSYAVTAIPGTVMRGGADPDFGLAATDPAGRRRALDFTAALREHVAGLVRHTRPGAVVAVELHSAPTGRGAAGPLAESLTEIAGWDWSGALVTVEHCDAADGIGPPQKGYRPIAEELAVIARVRTAAPRTPIGLTVNWARSVIERHDPAAAVEHLRQAAAPDVPLGLMFSGCADADGEFGAAWLDAHLPPGYPDSLLDAAQATRSWRAAGPLAFAGLKMGVRPLTATEPERLAALTAALELLEQARA